MLRSSCKNRVVAKIEADKAHGSWPDLAAQDWDDTLFPTTWLESKKAPAISELLQIHLQPHRFMHVPKGVTNKELRFLPS